MILSVENGKQKQNNYIVQIDRYNKAVRYKFYYEAMIIVYAMLEDRINSFLYYLNIVDRKRDGNIKFIKKNYQYVIYIYSKYTTASNTKIYFNKIYSKIDVIRSMLLWYKNEKNIDNYFYKTIVKKCDKLDVDKLLEVFNSLNRWCEYRNKIIHGLMDKNSDSINSDLEFETKNAYDLVKFIDLQVKRIKRVNIQYSCC